MGLHPRTRRLMARVGENLATWRAIQGLTATAVADRAGITRATLRAIEHHPETVRFESILAVAAVLGMDTDIARAFDPVESDRGRILLEAAARRQGQPR